MSRMKEGGVEQGHSRQREKRVHLEQGNLKHREGAGGGGRGRGRGGRGCGQNRAAQAAGSQAKRGFVCQALWILDL